MDGTMMHPGGQASQLRLRREILKSTGPQPKGTQMHFIPTPRVSNISGGPTEAPPSCLPSPAPPKAPLYQLPHPALPW